MCMYVGGLVTKKTSGIGCTEAVVTSSYDLPSMLAGKQAWILWKSSTCC